jgi:hypothetical protein
MGGLQAFQFYIKQRMEASLERDVLHTITLPVAEVQWYEEGREILVDDKMFDIKTYSITDGVFTAQGVFDEKETEIVKLLSGHWSDKEQTHFVVQLLLLSHCIILFSFYLVSFGVTVYRNKPISLITLLYNSPLLSIISPPPKACYHLSYTRFN